MESRKQKEIEYYDQETGKFSLTEEKESGSRHDFNPFLLESYNFLRRLVEEKAKNKKILDYGCGTGVHLVWLAKTGNRVVAIDLSKNSLKLAEEKARREGIENKVEILSMDCEKLDFPDDSFDVVFDGGTFSSLDMKKALPEIARVLKPNGFLIGIETLGHNPFTNFKRRINRLRKSRTDWATSHIFKMKDLKEAKEHFDKIEPYFFNLFSWVALPFLGLPGGKIRLKLLEKTDKFFLLFFPFLKKYSFKIVFVFSLPRKTGKP